MDAFADCTAAVFDCEGERPGVEEKAFFRDVAPAGFIVFARHCPDPAVLRAHCEELKACTGREEVLILIDQEGGRVARMAPPVYPAHPPPAVLGELWRLDPLRAKEAARLNAYLLGRLVADCGPNMNCIPVLDVPQPDASEVAVGDRALARHPDIVAALGHAVVEGLEEAGVTPVIKHMPGHGRALCDSHDALPRITASREDLENTDFAPFRALAATRAGMTAHVLYEALDPASCATFSSAVTGTVIRKEIGFDGLLLSDDLKMHALDGSLESRVVRALDAGCDIALCCNFSMHEKKRVEKVLRPLRADSLRRIRATPCAPQPVPGGEEPGELYRRLLDLLKPVWRI